MRRISNNHDSLGRQNVRSQLHTLQHDTRSLVAFHGHSVHEHAQSLWHRLDLARGKGRQFLPGGVDRPVWILFGALGSCLVQPVQNKVEIALLAILGHLVERRKDGAAVLVLGQDNVRRVAELQLVLKVAAFELNLADQRPNGKGLHDILATEKMLADCLWCQLSIFRTVKRNRCLTQHTIAPTSLCANKNITRRRVAISKVHNHLLFPILNPQHVAVILDRNLSAQPVPKPLTVRPHNLSTLIIVHTDAHLGPSRLVKYKLRREVVQRRQVIRLLNRTNVRGHRLAQVAQDRAVQGNGPALGARILGRVPVKDLVRYAVLFLTKDAAGSDTLLSLLSIF